MDEPTGADDGANSEPAPKPVDHSATGQAAGYIHQPLLALIALLNEGRQDPTATVLIEGLDDVVVMGGRGRELLQSKHSVSEKVASFGDTAQDLWKSLHVWADHVRSGRGDERDAFVLVTTSAAKAGSAASMLRNGPGYDPQSAFVMLDAVAATNEPPSNRSAYVAWMALDTAARRHLLRRFRDADRSLRIDEMEEALQNALRSEVRGAARRARMARDLQGWWATRAARHLVDRAPIEWTELEEQIHRSRDSLADDTLPLDASLKTYEHTLDPTDEAHKYVKQLRLVGKGDYAVLNAIEDFIKAERAIAEWTRDDLFAIGELPDYYDLLKEEWKHYRREVLDSLGEEADPERLKSVGRDIVDAVLNFQLHIRERRRDRFIMRGSYHRLADDLAIGWHPKYNEHIK